MERIPAPKSAAGSNADALSRLRRDPALEHIAPYLSLRSAKLPTGILSKDRQRIAERVEAALYAGAGAGKAQSEYRKLAARFSKLIAVRYLERGVHVRGITDSMSMSLPMLGRHLRTELDTATEHGLPNPGVNLSRYSASLMLGIKGLLRHHRHGAVRSNADTIFNVAMKQRRPQLAAKLAEGAQGTYDRLAGHRDRIVRSNAGLLLYAALLRGDLQHATKMASIAQGTYAWLIRHPEETVRSNAGSIMHAVFLCGDVQRARSLAEGARVAYDMLKCHRHRAVRNNARTIMYAMFNSGSLSLPERLARGAGKAHAWLSSHDDELVRRNSGTILQIALGAGRLALVKRYARIVAHAHKRLGSSSSAALRVGARSKANMMLRTRSLSRMRRLASKLEMPSMEAAGPHAIRAAGVIQRHRALQAENPTKLRLESS
ncbi:MAG: hypothetical protein M1321_03200 [Candidatus Marsarchaeota archaeon]|nr:hypothetical protein [Candidatus Marsarchaeota archaeon]